jgi:hypothetical protein
LHYEAVTHPAELEIALERFLEVEGSGWKDGAGSAVNQHPRLVAFYRQLAREFGARRACRINLLRLGGKVIAGQFGLVTNQQLNLLKIGYAPDYAHVAPGHLIMQHTIESVCADHELKRLSFVTSPNWAHLWKPEATPVHCVSVFRNAASGRLLACGARVALAWSRWKQARQDADAVSPAP